MRNKLFAAIGVGIMGVALIAIPANAGSVLPKGKAIDFSSSGPGHTQHPGGTVSFTNGFGNVFSVTDAPISELHAPPGSHGPAKNGLYAITGGELNLKTGGCISGCNGPNKMGFQGMNFSGVGSSLTLTGAIAGLGITSPEILIKGVFDSLGSSAPATHVSLNTPGNPVHPGTGGMTSYLDITYINPLIVDMLHLVSGAGVGQTTENFFDLNLISGTWDGTVGGTNLYVEPTPTPEPANAMLLGTALLAAAWITRRKMRANY
jgi:hypothetical protein